MTHSELIGIRQLPSLSMTELWAQWDKYFAYRPKYPNRIAIEARVAYQIQAAMFGGLSPHTKRLLENMGQQLSKINTTQPKVQQLLLGTRLLREWKQQQHEVLVREDGQFDYAGQSFKSLSAVARFITGTQWSGPVFFGLKS